MNSRTLAGYPMMPICLADPSTTVALLFNVDQFPLTDIVPYLGHNLPPQHSPSSEMRAMSYT